MDKDLKWIKSQVDHYIKEKDYDMARKQAIYHRDITGFDANLKVIEINKIEAKNKVKPKKEKELK
jgi:hypothetical protein